MNIAELFVNLGIKGNEKTVGAIAGVQKGLKDTASEALVAKAALVGAMYALERLFATSGQAGTNLTNFNALLGGGMVQTLQRYQYAARQVGVSNQEVEGTFKALQATMTKTLMGEGAPKGLARVAQLTGGLTAEDIKKFADQPQLLIQRLQEYASKETNAGLKNEVLKSFGVSDGMIAAFNRRAFRPEVMARAPTYSDKEVGQLDRANIAWENLGNTIQMAIGHFNAAHGGQLVGEITKVVTALTALSEKFVQLAETAKLFDKLTMVFQGWGYIFTGISAAIKDVNDLASKASDKAPAVGAVPGGAEPEKKSYTERLENALIGGGQGESLIGILIDALKEGLTAKEPPKTGGAAIIPMRRPGEEIPSAYRLNPKSVTPSLPQTASGEGGSTQNVNVNQTLNFHHDGTDVKKTSDSVKQAVRATFRQMPALGQGS